MGPRGALFLVSIGFFVAAISVVIIRPFATCGAYINLLIIKYCGQPITEFGMDPNTFTALLLSAIGLAVLVLAIQIRGSRQAR